MGMRTSRETEMPFSSTESGSEGGESAARAHVPLFWPSPEGNEGLILLAYTILPQTTADAAVVVGGAVFDYLPCINKLYGIVSRPSRSSKDQDKTTKSWLCLGSQAPSPLRRPPPPNFMLMPASNCFSSS
jgi:hypothetical protein